MFNKLLKIPNKEITFVIQGPVFYENNITKKSCESIRQYFPESKIILSTWKNSNSSELNIDQKIESDDPGANSFLYINNNKIFNNINRMIISSYNGLSFVKTKFAVKLRSDMYFNSSNLSKLLSIAEKSNSNYSKKKIIIPSNMTINPDREIKLLFHPSDHFFAGLSEDLLNLFNIPLMNNEQMKYFKNTKLKGMQKLPILPQYTCEQYLFYSFIRKKIDVNFENAFDYNNKNKLLHDKVFSDLFLMFRNTRIGVNGYKYPINFFSSSIYYAYTEYEFKNILEKKQFFDLERIVSNFVKFLKLSALFFSKTFYLKIKNFFIKKY